MNMHREAMRMNTREAQILYAIMEGRRCWRLDGRCYLDALPLGPGDDYDMGVQFRREIADHLVAIGNIKAYTTPDDEEARQFFVVTEEGWGSMLAWLNTNHNRIKHQELELCDDGPCSECDKEEDVQS